ncbi:hypothetical protein [Spartinivicinus poritis]|uniref:Uncharacterized protein n=1 Tax=Spartinivicinus poritis TaxID=2994640 RepID=A0ABT5U802_9GAMM|nr:hypothetical protein [Spartinivicinus sp. A2-2]MDE1462506.1 hypothetical protein [Spartinivicinus sp. A2-2]
MNHFSKLILVTSFITTGTYANTEVNVKWVTPKSTTGVVEASVTLKQLKISIDLNNETIYQGLSNYLNELLMIENSKEFCQSSGYENLNECYLREGLYLPDTGLDEHNKLTFSLVCRNLKGKQGSTTRYTTTQNGQATNMISGPYLVSFDLPGYTKTNANGQAVRILAEEKADNSAKYTPVEYQLKAGDSCYIEAQPNSIGAIIEVKFVEK